LNTPKHSAEQQSRILADALSIAHCTQAYHVVLLITAFLLMALARHQSLSVADRAVGLIARLILTDLGTNLPDFFPLEFVLQLRNSLKWRPAGAKLRSADLLCLLSNWVDDEFVKLIVEGGVLPPLLELFEAGNSELTVT
jgi:hypothetical protein